MCGGLKSGFTFVFVPTQFYHANSAWQVLNLMAFNLRRVFQTKMNEQKRAKTQKREPTFDSHNFRLYGT